MDTFFSGTDINTLKEEGIDRNNFVSLIVNNEGTYTAAITRRVKTKQVSESISYEFFGEGEKLNTKNYVSNIDEVEWFYLKIEKEGEEYSFFDINTRLEEIKQQKKEKAKVATPIGIDKYPNVINSQLVKAGPANINKDKIEQKTVQETFFNNIKESELPFDDLDNDIHYGQVFVDPKTIKSLVRQLITCSIIIPNESKIDINKWAKNMSILYEKRFGKGEDGMKKFQEWADMYIEFLTWNIEDDSLTAMGFDKTEIQSICAHNLIEALTMLPENIYIKAYINELEKYLIL